jgi:feruloyl-CoA synthase
MPARFALPAVIRVPRPGGGFVLRSPVPEPASVRCIGEWLVRWAREAPERTFVAEREPAVGGGLGAWRRVSYGEALDQVRGLGQAVLDAGLSPACPLAILSGNSVAHMLLALAAMHVGVPVAPISVAYSLMTSDLTKLRALLDVLGPGAVWASGAAFDRVLAQLGLPVLDATPRQATVAVDRAFAAVAPDHVAKILFTSGSTGVPKGVVNTHRMLCANQAAIAACWPFLAERPPVIVDWLPWSHTFGANHNVNMVLASGGTLYIDGGKPAPGAFEITLANLRDTPSTLYFNVPRGFDMLVGALETDDALRATFFRDLDIMFYAAAALSPATWERLAACAERAGAQVAMASAWGSTETSPLVTQVHFPIDRAGVIGLPVPGLELAFAPSGDKLEMRVRGASVTPGYWRPGGAVEPAPRDELGFFPMGDAGRLAEDAHPERGVVFDGRTAENFKLASGTWVHVGELRVALLAACSPLVADAVITGHDREHLGALVWPAPGRAADAAFRDELAAGIGRCNLLRSTSSTRIERVIVLAEPPSIDAGEITDKGSLNSAIIREGRRDFVEHLYTGFEHPLVIAIA